MKTKKQMIQKNTNFLKTNQKQYKINYDFNQNFYM